MLVGVGDAESPADLVEPSRLETPVEGVFRVGGALGDVAVQTSDASTRSPRVTRVSPARA